MKEISVQLVKVDYSVENSFFKSNSAEVIEIRMAIIQLHIGATKWEVESELKKYGMRPAKYPELIAMKEFPELEEEYTIFASGSEITECFFAGSCPYVKIKNGNVIKSDHNNFGNDLGRPYFAAVHEKR